MPNDGQGNHPIWPVIGYSQRHLALNYYTRFEWFILQKGSLLQMDEMTFQHENPK